MLDDVLPTQTATEDGRSVGRDWAELAAGSSLGRYVVVERIGAGAMGVVYAARDETLKRNVAVKVMGARRVHDARDQARFEQEARTLAAVKHPAVVEVYDVGRQGTRAYLVMRRLSGRTLRDWLLDCPGPRAVWTMFARVAEGLDAAHAAGVLHCDFKPENVLLDAEGRPQIADFGLARFEGQDTRPGAEPDSTRASGTFAYMAPELLSGEVHSLASDVYAFHVALFEALAGQRPFSGSDVVDQKKNGVPDHVLRAVPRFARARLRRGLHPDPARRPSSSALSSPRSVPALSLGVLVVGGFVVGVSQLAATEPPCTDRAAVFDGEAAHWDARSNNSTVRATVEHVEGRLSEWRGEWKAHFERACLAKNERELECLARIRVAAESWMHVRPDDAESVAEVAEWQGRLSSLPEPSTCAPDSNGQPRADLVQAHTDASFALRRGELRTALALGDALAARALVAGDAGMRLEALILTADALSELRRYAEADARLDEVILAAESTGRWRVAASATVQRIWVVGIGDTDLARAADLATQATAYGARIGEEARVRLESLSMLSGVLEGRGELDAAAERLDEAAKLLAETGRSEYSEFAQIRFVLTARRVSLAAKRGKFEAVLASRNEIDALEAYRGAYDRSVLASRGALAYAESVEGDPDRAIAEFEALAERYREIGPDMAFWVHQNSVNAAMVELRERRFESAARRLELACGGMAAARSDDHTNVLICRLHAAWARAGTGAAVDMDEALATLGKIEARYERTREPVQQAIVAAAAAGVLSDNAERVSELLEAELVRPALARLLASLRSEVNAAESPRPPAE